MGEVNHSDLAGRSTRPPYAATMDDRHARWRRRLPDPRRRPDTGHRALSSASFDRLVDDALASLPAPLLAELDNIEVTVEDVPPADALEDGQEVVLLGLYQGVPRTARGWGDPQLPDRVTIFRRPLELRARSRRDLAALVRETVVHEIAHHFGIDDDRLDELGWG